MLRVAICVKKKKKKKTKKIRLKRKEMHYAPNASVGHLCNQSTSMGGLAGSGGPKIFPRGSQ